jgi:cell division protein FtsN
MATPRNTPPTRKRSEGNFLLGMVVGVVLGLAVALAVALYLNKTPMPFTSHTAKPAGKASPESDTPIAGLPSPAPSLSSAEKPKFDFYKILPGQEEPVTEKELRDRTRQARTQPSSQPGAPKDVYFIQAGSFQNPAEADNQKARLAILGFDSSVEPANLPDKGTWYRVRLGPYNKVEDLNKVRQALAQNGIDASLVKIKEQQRQ